MYPHVRDPYNTGLHSLLVVVRGTVPYIQNIRYIHVTYIIRAEKYSALRTPPPPLTI